MKPPILILAGGEPLIHPRSFDILGKASAGDLKLTVFANGTIITPEKAAMRKAANVAYVGVSLDGISKIYDEFRRKGGLLLRRREQQTRHAWISIPFAGCLTDAERSSIKLVNYTGG